ncbi:CLUMA_CG018281, isoform A [Clunio marinus]|uniref:CLUMA_CG018281, isoform A n=1 Tax=Clunio marinus TaxID=568069 RepID=A0A1J1IYP9_9DIPT|nr:CLUMA_CG018281, isoform A [Clunio marinus]
MCRLFALSSDPDDDIAQQIQEAEAKAPEDLTEEDKMVLLGRPKNGDIIRAQLRIKESKEFKYFLKSLHIITLNSCQTSGSQDT